MSGGCSATSSRSTAQAAPRRCSGRRKLREDRAPRANCAQFQDYFGIDLGHQALSTLGTSYVAATTAALGAALGLNTVARRCPPLVGRLVPFCAVALANGVNTTLMRRLELQHGIMLETEEGQQVGQSKIAARSGISKVILSRVLMTAPGIQTNCLSVCQSLP